MSTDNVKALIPGAPIPGRNSEPHRDIVKHCEDLLREAQSGKIRGLAYVCFDSTEHYVTGSCGEIRSTSLIGGLFQCQQAISKAQDREDLPT